MTREEAIEFLECKRAYYASLSTDPNPNVKATKVCGYTLAESANACLMAIKALEQESCDKCEVGNPCLYCKHEFEPKESEDKRGRKYDTSR